MVSQTYSQRNRMKRSPTTTKTKETFIYLASPYPCYLQVCFIITLLENNMNDIFQFLDVHIDYRMGRDLLQEISLSNEIYKH